MVSSGSVMGVLPAVRTAFRLLPNRRRRHFVLVVLTQVFISLLDLIGVLLVAAVGVLSVQVIQGSDTVPAIMQPVVDPLSSRGMDLRQITFTLAVAAALFLVTKSFLSSLLSRRILLFLAAQQAQLSGSLLARLLSQSVIEIQDRSSLTTAYAIVQGATNAVVGILGSAALVASETALLVLFGVTLLWINPVITLVAIAFLTLVGLGSYRYLGNWSARIGTVNADTTVRGNTYVQDAISTYREISVLGRTGLYVSKIRSLLVLGSRAQADAAFISQIPKFVFESSVTVGAVVLAGFLFLTSDPTTAVGTMVLFLAAGGRVMPSIMRLQGAFITIRASAGSSVATFELAEQLQGVSELAPDTRSNEDLLLEIREPREDFLPTISFESFTFWYPRSGEPALKDITLAAAAGSSLALVGSTGAGKSTLADALLGVIEPASGQVRIGGLPPSEAVARWPGAIAYVPQHVALIEGSIRNNVCLGLPSAIIDDAEVWAALELAHLADFLRDQREGLDTHIGERGVRLSGGQRQRLGLARALFTRPRLLVLDEATSALDAQTEGMISSVINALHGKATVVVVAHRLATVRNFDAVAYLEKGELAHVGSFEDVRSHVPRFEEQATILGL